MAALPNPWNSRWESIRGTVEHAYWEIRQQRMIIENMPQLVYDLADALESDASFVVTAIGGPWDFSPVTEEIPGVSLRGRRTVDMGHHPRRVAVEVAARKMIPSNIEWIAQAMYDGTVAFALVSGPLGGLNADGSIDTERDLNRA